MSEIKKQILVADDDPDQVFQLKHYLEKWGYEVIPAESRAEAERYLETGCPDLAILDLMMEEVYKAHIMVEIRLT